MELSYDWKAFQSVFAFRKNLKDPDVHAPLYLVVDKKVVVSIFSETEDFSDWIGATVDEILAEFPQRDLLIYEREQVEQWTKDCSLKSHYYDQMLRFRNEAKAVALKYPGALLGPSSRRSNKQLRIQELICAEHFLLNAIQSWWKKVFPSNYGIYIQITGSTQNKPDEILMKIQGGKLISFQIPDLSSLSLEQRKNSVQVMKHLKDRYMVPIQGIFVSAQEWKEWSSSQNPWMLINVALKKKKCFLPLRSGLQGLIKIRATLGI